MRNYVSFKVKIDVGWLESYAGCGRNLGRTQFFTHYLAALRLPPGDPSAAEKWFWGAFTL